MAEMTLQPTDVEILEEWIRAWRFAVGVLHMVSAKAMGVPSTDLEYRQLLQEINDVLYTKTGGTLYYGAPGPIVDAGKEILMAVKGVDPSQTALVGASPITDVTTTGVEVGGAIATAGAGLFSKVGRKILISSIVACLGLEVFAGLLPQEQKNDLYTSLDPYSDEDGNVLVHTDSDGKTRVPKSYIEAVRGKLVAMGAYIEGNEVKKDDVLETLDYTNIPNDAFPIQLYPANTLFTVGFGNYPSYTSNHYNYYSNVPGIRFNVYFNAGKVLQEAIFASDNPNILIYCSWGSNTPELDPYVVVHTATYDSKTVYYVGSSRWVDTNTDYSQYANIQPSFMATDILPQTVYDTLAWLMVYNSEEGGVQGITPQPDAVLPKDMDVDISTYMPAWSDDKKTFKAVSYDEDRHIEGLVDIDFYPVTLTGVQGENQDITTPQDDAITGDAPSDADMDYIFPAIQDFYEFIHNYPNYPDIVIPAGDSGDTPTPTPPVITGAGSDLIAIYNPTKQEIKDFNQFLWDLDPTNLTNWKKVIANPIDAVISLHMIYVTPITGEPRHIKCGYIETDVSSKIVTNQYKDVDCGEVNLTEYFSNVWDYIDTDVQIYLPFIGIVPLDTREIMNSILKVMYRVDVYTGTCLAQIIVQKDNSYGVLYTYTGNCAVPLPLTSGSFTGVFSTLLSACGTAVFGGGPAMAAGEVAGDLLKGRVKQNIQRSGSIGANAGAMGIRTPYLIITRPVPYDASEYSKQYGYPLNETIVLGNLSGYTRVKDIHLQGIPCTDDELEMIERLLKDGVIIN